MGMRSFWKDHQEDTNQPADFSPHQLTEEVSVPEVSSWSHRGGKVERWRCNKNGTQEEMVSFHRW